MKTPLRNSQATIFPCFTFAIACAIALQKLWKSDGTAVGAVLLKDINPGGGRRPQEKPMMKARVPFAALCLVGLMLIALQSTAQTTYEPYAFSTLAGGGGFTSPDQPGTAARFWGPTGVVVDSAGNLYVADLLNHAIRKVTSSGMITTLAGLPGSVGSADGQGSEARFLYPDRLVLDPAGNIFVSDNGNTIRKVTAGRCGDAGAVGSADGIGSAARFNGPSALAVDTAGNVYVADGLNVAGFPRKSRLDCTVQPRAGEGPPAFDSGF